MKLREHRTGNLVRTRRRQPDFVRKAGPMAHAPHHEPEVCPACGGRGIGYDPQNTGDALVQCGTCGGEGEI